MWQENAYTRHSSHEGAGRGLVNPQAWPFCIWADLFMLSYPFGRGRK